MNYNRYPGINANNEFPPEVRQALANSGEIFRMAEGLVTDHVAEYDQSLAEKLYPYQKIDVVPPGNPVAPTLSMVMGAVMVQAHDLDTRDDVMPPDFSHYNIEASAPEWRVVGTITSPSGASTVYGLPSGNVDIRLVAFDTAGNASNKGALASITVVPIETAEQVREDYLAKQAEVDETIADFQGSVDEAVAKAEAAESAATAAEARAAEASSRSMSSLSNGNFEDGLKYWKPGPTLSTTAHSGGQSALLTPINTLMHETNLPVVVGQIWELQAFYRPADSTALASELAFEFMLDGTTPNTTLKTASAMDWASSGAIRLTVPAGVDSMGLRIRPVSGSWNVDDVVLRDVTDVVRLEQAASEARQKAEAAEARAIAVEQAQGGIESRLAASEKILTDAGVAGATNLSTLDQRLSAAFQEGDRQALIAAAEDAEAKDAALKTATLAAATADAKAQAEAAEARAATDAKAKADAALAAAKDDAAAKDALLKTATLAAAAADATAKAEAAEAAAATEALRIAQTEAAREAQEAEDAAKAYADAQASGASADVLATAKAYAEEQAQEAEDAAKAAAALDATAKAEAAEAAAAADAKAKADAALAAAKVDAKTKADAAEEAAKAAAALDATAKAEAAEAAAAADAKAKADAALAAAKADATAKDDALKVIAAADAQAKFDEAKALADAAQAKADALAMAGDNLVLNGSGELGNLSGWPSPNLRLAPELTPVGAPNAIATTLQTGFGVHSSERIVVDPSRTYIMSAKMYGKSGMYHYLAVSQFDVDGRTISYQTTNRKKSADTTLAAPITRGDTTITLSGNGSQWNGSNLNSLGWWPYVTQAGIVFNRSDNYTQNLYRMNGFTVSGNTITLPSPWTGPDIPAGTEVGLMGDGGSYLYPAARIMGTDGWEDYAGRFGGGVSEGNHGGEGRLFRPGVASIGVGFLLNNSTRVQGVSGFTATRLIDETATMAAETAQAAADTAQAAADAAQARADAAHTAAGNAQTTADLAVASASGKSKVYRSTASASGTGTAVGDVWMQFKDTTYSVVIGQWTWSGNGWKKNALSHETISSVDIGTLTVVGQSRLADVVAKQIYTDMLTANEVFARRMVVSNGNLWPDPQFERGAVLNWEVVDGGIEVVSNGTGGVGGYSNALTLDVRPGEEYIIAFDREDFGGTGTGNVAVNIETWANGESARIAYTAHSTIGPGAKTINYVVPDNGADYLRFGFWAWGNSSTLPSGTRVRLDNFKVSRKADTVLIGDGAVTADKITANQELTTKIFGAEHGVIQYLTATEKALFLQGLDAIGESWIDGVNIKDGQITARLMNFIKENGVNRLRIDSDGVMLETMTGRAIMRLDPTGFYGYNSSGAVTFKFDPATGRMMAVNGDFTGDIRVGSTITGALIQTTSLANRGVKMNTGGLTAYDPMGLVTFSIDAATGEAKMQSDLGGNMTTVSGKGLVIQRASADSEGGLEDLVRITGEEIRRITITNTSGEGGDVLMDDAGGVAGEVGSFNSLVVAGEDLTDILDQRPRGIVEGALSWRDITGIDEPTTKEYGFLQMSFEVELGRLYRVNLEPLHLWDRKTGTSYLSFRYTTGNVVPMLTSPIMWRQASNVDPTIVGIHQFGGVWFLRPDDSWFSAGESHATLNFLLSLSGSQSLDGPTSSVSRLTEVTAWAEDIGADISTNTIRREERISATNASTSGATTTTTSTKIVQTWVASSTTSLISSGTKYNYNTQYMYQGQSQYYTTGGSKRAHATFANAGDKGNSLYAAGRNAKSVLKIEVWVYFEHWHSNSGGISNVGWYDSDTSQTDPTLEGGKDVYFRRKQGRWVDVTTNTAIAQFKAGRLRGVGVRAPDFSTDTKYYGYAAGTGSNRPKIRVTYMV